MCEGKPFRVFAFPDILFIFKGLQNVINGLSVQVAGVAAVLHSVIPPAAAAPAVFPVPGLKRESGFGVYRILYDIVNAGECLTACHVISEAESGHQNRDGGRQTVCPADGEDPVIGKASVLFPDKAAVIPILRKPGIAGDSLHQICCCFLSGNAAARGLMPDAVNRFHGAVKDSFITGLQIIQEKLYLQVGAGSKEDAASF